MYNGFGKKKIVTVIVTISHFALPFMSLLCDMKCQAIVTSYELRIGFQYCGRGGDC
jgi:hypothetical protein